MEQPAWHEDEDTRFPSRLFLSVAIAGLGHFGLYVLFQRYDPAPLEADYALVDVQILSQPPRMPAPIDKQASTLEETRVIEPPAAAPNLVPAPKPAAKLPNHREATPPAPGPDIEPSFAAARIRPPDGQSQTFQVLPVPEGDTLIPDRWRLPVGARVSLEDTKPSRGPLGNSLDCLQGFRVECAELRKSVFADDQLTETELVWMASHPHSGLSDSSLFGLSEEEIRERLGIPTAGKNGFMILPGIVIDGPIWDALHGVNKNCNYSVGTGATGQRELKKNCDPLRPSSKDRIRFIPKPTE